MTLDPRVMMDNKLSIPMTSRCKEGAVRTAGNNLIVALVVMTLAPAIAGGLAFMANNFIRGVSAIVAKPAVSATSLLLVTYMLAGVIVLLLVNASTLVEGVVNAIDHWAVRVLSVVVVGASDLARGSAWVAVLAYVSVGLLLLFGALTFSTFSVDGSEIGRQMQAILGGSARDYPSLLQGLTGSWLLGLSLLIGALPIAMAASTRWQVMVRRPKLPSFLLGPHTASPGGEIVVAHASDLHSMPLTHGQVADEVLSSAMQSILAAEVDAVLLTGDLTDDGSCSAWNGLLGLPAMSALRERLVIAPGNHDLNAVHKGIFRTLFDMESTRRTGTHLRALNFMRAADRIMGDRARLLCPYTGATSLLSEVMLRASEDLARWDKKEVCRRSALLPAELLEKLFPMIVRVGADAMGDVGCQFVVWNSVKLNRWPLLNAIGEVSRDQLKRGRGLLERLNGPAPVVHLMHHQIGMPNIPPVAHDPLISWWKRLLKAGMGLQNPADVLDMMGARAQRTVVLHGHHHKFFVLEEANAMAKIVSAPSATHGVETTYSEVVSAEPIGRWLKLTLAVAGSNVDITKLEVCPS